MDVLIINSRAKLVDTNIVSAHSVTLGTTSLKLLRLINSKTQSILNPILDYSVKFTQHLMRLAQIFPLKFDIPGCKDRRFGLLRSAS